MSLRKTFDNHKSGQVREFLKENINKGANVELPEGNKDPITKEMVDKIIKI